MVRIGHLGEKRESKLHRRICPRSAYISIPGESFKFGIDRRSTSVASSQYGLGVGSTYGVAKGALSFTSLNV